jgi:nitroimidazol reductase NimA-like FMN-containing flavoprotein (pyridoxamine 5'-phosphate oxidase superfamily)
LEEEKSLRRKLKELFDKQRIGVLSTQKRNRPYASLVAFAVTDDLKSFVFATPRTTRKYSNIIASSRAALLIDNRSNKMSDFRKAMAVTVKTLSSRRPARFCAWKPRPFT